MISAQNLESIIIYLTLEINQYYESGINSFLSKQAAASSYCFRLEKHAKLYLSSAPRACPFILQ